MLVLLMRLQLETFRQSHCDVAASVKLQLRRSEMGLLGAMVDGCSALHLCIMTELGLQRHWMCRAH